MKNLKHITLLMLTISVFGGCKKSSKFTNTFTVRNSTKYKIENITLQLAGQSKTISIEPVSSAKSFNFDYEISENAPVDAGLELIYTLVSYSDSSKIYNNNIGHTYPQNKLRSYNELMINLASQPSGKEIFDVKVY